MEKVFKIPLCFKTSEKKNSDSLQHFHLFCIGSVIDFCLLFNLNWPLIN